MGRDSEQKGEGGRSGEQGRKERRQQQQKPHVMEWVVGALCGLLIVAMIGFVLYHGLAESAPRPDITVESGEIQATRGGFQVDFRAINRGDRTAAAVTVEGVLQSDGREVEASEVQLDYVPAHSERRGALFFSADPRRHQLELRALGYTEP